MKKFIVFVIGAAMSVVASAQHYEWMNKFDRRAELDRNQHLAILATRFALGEMDVKDLANEAKSMTDVYMMLKLRELAGVPTQRVLDTYRQYGRYSSQTNYLEASSSEGKGWGKMAKELGIKPGSAAFHKLKAGHDLAPYFGQYPVFSAAEKPNVEQYGKKVKHHKANKGKNGNGKHNAYKENRDH